MNQFPLFRLSLTALEVEGEESRWYEFSFDPDGAVLRTSKDGDPVALAAHGVVAIDTGEAMGGQVASVNIPVGQAGRFLRTRARPQDCLRIELLGDDGIWKCAFDGFLASVRVTKTATPQGFAWAMVLAASGWKRMFEQQWVNWQGALSVTQDTKLFGPGAALFKKLQEMAISTPVTDLLEVVVRDAVRAYLKFSVRGREASAEDGGPLQLAAPGRDWQTAFSLWLADARAWWFEQNSPLWSIIAGLAEADVHEVFWTYAPARDGRDGEEIPTIVFRPVPFPGPPVKDGVPKDDPGLWKDLDLLVVGKDGGPGVLQVVSNRSDDQRANVFTFCESSSNTDSVDTHMRKVLFGLWSDETRVRRYGLSFEQVSVETLVHGADQLFEDYKALTARVAHQNVILPDTFSQVRVYALLPGIHIGTVLEDHSDGLATGYVVGVQHRIMGSTSRFSANTTVSLSRVIEDVDRDQYVEAARALAAGLVHREYVQDVDWKDAAANFADPSHQQPAVPPEGVDSSLVKTSSGAMNVPDTRAACNLKLLQQQVLDPLKIPHPTAYAPGFRVTSGFRSPAVNTAADGSARSRHLLGLACDLVPNDGNFDALRDAILAGGSPLLHECFVEDRPGHGKHVHVSILQVPSGASPITEYPGSADDGGGE